VHGVAADTGQDVNTAAVGVLVGDGRGPQPGDAPETVAVRVVVEGHGARHVVGRVVHGEAVAAAAALERQPARGDGVAPVAIDEEDVVVPRAVDGQRPGRGPVGGVDEGAVDTDLQGRPVARHHPEVGPAVVGPGACGEDPVDALDARELDREVTVRGDGAAA